jgi:hypothetical protein
MLVPLTLAIVIGLFYISGAQAVHDEDFELEGNQAVDAGGASFDWTSFFNAAGQESPVLPDASRPGFTSSGFAKDFTRNANGSYATADPSTFATGSKDTLSISPGWQCNRDNNVNDKIDIVNAYAVTYTDPVTEDEILYFALERFANDGDANVGVWFLQGDVTCVSAGGSVPFTGNHQDGDLLIVSEFSNGGDVSTIQAYKWEGDDNTGGINPQAVAEGVDCKESLGGDSICATVNDSTNGVLDPPWDTENKRGGGNNQISEFFEGGLNLTAENLGGRCFNTFIADTRSSTSLTATLFDFALGKLGACGLTMSTTPLQTTRPLGSTDPITDRADVTGTSSGGGTAPTPTGSVLFFLCGPSDLTPANTGTCEGTSGTQVGSAVTVTEFVPGTARATSADAQSLIDEGIGKYCFRATFTADPADPNYAGQTAPTSNPTQECFTVTDVASTRTEQSWLPQDTAIVTSAGGSAIAGSVTWSFYENGTCAGTAARTLGPVTVDATGRATTNNTTYETTAKTISWKAVFTSSNGVGSGPPAPCETMTVSVLDNDITTP